MVMYIINNHRFVVRAAGTERYGKLVTERRNLLIIILSF